MKTWFQRAGVACLLVVVASYAWISRHHVASVVAAPATEAQQMEVAEEHTAQEMVTVTGPMADYVQHKKPAVIETVKFASPSPVASDHVGASTVSAVWRALHKTFEVRGMLDFPIEVQAHVSTPRLHGTFRSFVQEGDAQSSDARADVECLVLNEQQYSDLQHGRPGEALFSAEDSHNQEVNVGLPPTMDQAARYHLVFRNNSKNSATKFVEADFRLDF